MAKSSELTGIYAEAIKRFDELQSGHRSWTDKVDRRYNAFRGVMEENSEALKWTSKLAPPYANHIVETTVAGLIDDTINFKVKPRPKFYNPGEFQAARDGAKAHERLLTSQLSFDHFDEKQRWYILQNAIAGLTVGKISWGTVDRMRKHLATRPRKLADPETGATIGIIPELYETETAETVFDGPSFEVIDVRDWFWDEAAVSLDSCPFVVHRLWMTLNECKILAAKKVYKNVDQLSDSQDFSSESSSREKTLWDVNRTKGRIEVLEIYRRTPDGIHTMTIGNRNVILVPDRPLPYWHQQMPFVVCSTQSDLFRIPGMSQVEKIASLQEALWTVSNQRIDNLSLLNNAIVLMRDDVDDPNAFDFFPGAVNLVSDPAQVQLWQPSSEPASISLNAEGMLKSDMQNLAGGFPFAPEAVNLGLSTATEASLLAGLAARSLAQIKTEINFSYRRAGQQMLELNQQYIRDPVYVSVLGIDTAEEIHEIVPMMLQGSFAFDISPMNESLMRNERRAEAQTLFQVLSQGAQVAAASGTPIDMKPVIEDLLESFDKQDTDRYFRSATNPAAPQQPLPGPSGQPDPNQPGGVTNPALAAGPQAPSNASSLSPEMMMQRSLAATGGGRSA